MPNQPLLPPGEYLGIFMGFSTPRAVRQLGGDGDELRSYARFTVTHSAEGRRLAQPACVSKGLRPRLTFNERTGQYSFFAVLLAVLMKKSPAEIVAAARRDPCILDIDGTVGTPVRITLDKTVDWRMGAVNVVTSVALDERRDSERPEEHLAPLTVLPQKSVGALVGFGALAAAVLVGLAALFVTRREV